MAWIGLLVSRAFWPRPGSRISGDGARGRMARRLLTAVCRARTICGSVVWEFKASRCSRRCCSWDINADFRRLHRCRPSCRSASCVNDLKTSSSLVWIYCCKFSMLALVCWFISCIKKQFPSLHPGAGVVGLRDWLRAWAVMPGCHCSDDCDLYDCSIASCYWGAAAVQQAATKAIKEPQRCNDMQVHRSP